MVTRGVAGRPNSYNFGEWNRVFLNMADRNSVVILNKFSVKYAARINRCNFRIK